MNNHKYFLLLFFSNTVFSFVRNFFPKHKHNSYINIKNKCSDNICEEQKIKETQALYDSYWFMIGKNDEFEEGKIKKIKILDKNYAVYKFNNTIYALNDVCSHRSASLSLGVIDNDGCVRCPYHNYGFNMSGSLTKLPFYAPEFQKSKDVFSVFSYDIVNHHNWIYINTYEFKNMTIKNKIQRKQNIFTEKEIDNISPYIDISIIYECNSRIVSENVLDIMHISVVHSFGNKESPLPLKMSEIIKVEDVPNHYKIIYEYKTGKNSLFKKLFNSDRLYIENEFILPSMTITRVMFNQYFKTVVTHALPISKNRTKFTAKVYRNFLNTNFIEKYIVDYLFRLVMKAITLQDKEIVESIDPENLDGKFNTIYDKIQIKFRNLYKKLYDNKEVI